MIKNKITSLSANRKLVLTSLFYIFFVIAFTYLTVLNEKTTLYQQLDEQLQDAAKVTKLLLPRELHHQNMASQDLNDVQKRAHIEALSEFTDQRDIIYIYTLIQRDNKVFFTSSSATPEERQSGENLSFYFDHYADVDPRVFDIFDTKKTTFLEYTDQWGTFRSVFMPNYAPDGSFYLTVADLSISHIDALLNKQILNSAIVGLLFLFFAYPIYATSTRKLKLDSSRLNDLVQDQALAFKTHQEKLVKNQRALLALAKESFIDQTKALNKIVSVAADQLEVARVSIWLYNKDRTASICQIQYADGEISTEQNNIAIKDYPHYFKQLSEEGFISADDVNSHPDTSEFLDGYTDNLGISSMLDTPIYSGGDVIGLSCFEHTGPQRKWTQEDEEFARSISDLCSQVFLNEQRKKAERLLSQQAHYDELTKLPNRTLFADRFSQSVARSERNNSLLAISFIDLDNFKQINDNFGHDAGDQLLIEVAKRLKETTRPTDTISRQGGDEFTLLLSDIDSKKYCEQLLGRVNKVLSQPYQIGDTQHKISASIGTTLYPNDESNLDSLLRHADQAMYQAKLLGKNRQCFFNPEDNQEIVHRQTQLQEIQNALIHNEFELYYQPKVNMRTGELLGAEALIRWMHPEKGLIPPLDFLPIIEGTELEIQLGDWVINQALQQMNAWETQGIHLEVSINIASHHLQSNTFVDQLTVALEAYPKLKSQQLQLEVLESSALSDLSVISQIIEQCQSELGVSVALDDFGTGYSALTHIRDLSANVIKIDRTFVRDILIDPSDYSIIEGIISLAQAFNHKIIAEGVEFTEQGLMLIIMGCDEAQGYGISRPLAVEQFETWLNHYQPNGEWLHYAELAKNLSLQDKRRILIQLTTQHWYSNILFILEAGLSDSKITECHLSVWFDRLKNEEIFPEAWLDQIKQHHDNLFNLALELVRANQNIQETAYLPSLDAFKAAYHDLNRLLSDKAAPVKPKKLSAIANT